MTYPSLEKYNEAFQQPLRTILADQEISSGMIATNGLGLPLALCGGFALTYTVNVTHKKYALRCFHKQSKDLEKRYSSLSKKLKLLNSPYFVDFEFQPKGIKILGNTYPIVKMAWANGITLGEFLDKKNQAHIEVKNLINSLKNLSSFLELNNIAHGDISPDNLMISNDGKNIVLIDYDGMYVEEIKGFGSSELGNRNFQHPLRSSSNFDKDLDRFSFIELTLGLEGLIKIPSLWKKTQSDANAIIFRANDYADPSSSKVFSALFNNVELSDAAKNFASICKAKYADIPSLEDFWNKKNIPATQVSITTGLPSKTIQYLSAFPVLDAHNYEICLKYVGDRVELIGKIVEVKPDKTRHGKPYIFINFGFWKDNIVKVSIWSEGLEILSDVPDASWAGKWVSIVGLIDSPYINRKYKYSHLSVTITQNNQIHVLNEKEAKFRLAGSSLRSTSFSTFSSSSTNKELLASILGHSSGNKVSSLKNHSSKQGRLTDNQNILDKIRQSQGVSSSQAKTFQSCNSNQHASSSVQSSSNCFIATEIYGLHAIETKTLRNWRDRVLAPYYIGRLVIKFYYFFSPFLVRVIRKNFVCRKIVKKMLNVFLKKI